MSVWCIDAGNTVLKLAIFHGEEAKWKSWLRREEIALLYEKFSGFPRPEFIAVAAARESDASVVEDLLSRVGAPLYFVRHDGPLPFEAPYISGTPGPDRLANVAAAREIHRPVMVVDFGTTTHIEVVDPKGDFAGGAIFPGIDLQRKALGLATGGRLPEIDFFTAAEEFPARSTQGAIAAGIALSQVGAVSEMHTRTAKLFDCAVPIIATGGATKAVRPLLPEHTSASQLTLDGVRILGHHLNRIARR